MAIVRAECRSDELRWFSLEQARVPTDDHPRNPGHVWAEIEGDE